MMKQLARSIRRREVVRRFLVCLLGLALTASLSQTADATSVWGSFDGSRINYAGGVLTTGSSHSTLRSIITGGGSTLAPSTATLTSGYLSGVDVFYTSLLRNPTGILSGAEQASLQTWVAGGGTLIVTADIFPLAAYESFTSVYGVTGYTATSAIGVGTTVATHPITSGVSNFQYNTFSTYLTAANALILGQNHLGGDFMAVLEPGTGFNVGGRVLVFGDHNMFADSNIGLQDNTLLATNMVQWAMIAEPPTLADLDIKPGSDPNSINLKSRGVLPVAILTTDDFDALQIDWTTILFGDPLLLDDGAIGVAPLRSGEEDVNGDGLIDLTLKFSMRDLVDNGALGGMSMEALLTGLTFDGMMFEASDSIRLVPPGDANNDLVVDAADYTVWANGFGGANPQLTDGDFNGDGSVDVADYTILANHFGQGVSAPAGAVAAVPEPSTLVLAGLGLVGLLAYGRRRRRA